MRAAATLAQVVQCHCGHTMTPNVARRQLYCSRGVVTPGHGRYVASEANLVPALKAEAARLRVPYEAAELAQTAASRGEAIAARLDRPNELYMAGDIDRAKYDAEKSRAQRDMEAIDAEAAIVVLPAAVDWQWPPGRLNEVLRSLWARVVLDDVMRVARVDWHVPAWRA